MLDHVSLGVTDIDRSRRFYDAVLRPLGLVRIVDFGEGRGSDYGAAPGSPGVEFTITREAEVKTPVPGAHLCFRAPDREAVDAFHAAALASGGHDDGRPGLRPHYHADYYRAFVLDPDGHRIEAVCHAPKAQPSSRRADAMTAEIELRAFRDGVEPEIGALLDVFVAIDSETDAFPVGDERRLWNPEALKPQDARLAAAEHTWHDRGADAAAKLVERLSRSD